MHYFGVCSKLTVHVNGCSAWSGPLDSDLISITSFQKRDCSILLYDWEPFWGRGRNVSCCWEFPVPSSTPPSQKVPDNCNQPRVLCFLKTHTALQGIVASPVSRQFLIRWKWVISPFLHVMHCDAKCRTQTQLLRFIEQRHTDRRTVKETSLRIAAPSCTVNYTLGCSWAFFSNITKDLTFSSKTSCHWWPTAVLQSSHHSCDPPPPQTYEHIHIVLMLNMSVFNLTGVCWTCTTCSNVHIHTSIKNTSLYTQHLQYHTTELLQVRLCGWMMFFSCFLWHMICGSPPEYEPSLLHHRAKLALPSQLAVSVLWRPGTDSSPTSSAVGPAWRIFRV